MIQGGGSLSLALKSGQRLRISSNVLRQKLERDEAPEPGVLSFVNHTHAATAELFDDAVVRNGLSNKGERVSHWAGILVFAKTGCQRIARIAANCRSFLAMQEEASCPFVPLRQVRIIAPFTAPAA